MTTSIFDNIEQFDDSVALIEGGVSHSYRDLVKDASELTADIPARALAVLICKNTYTCVAAYVGLVRRGAVPLLVHHSMDREKVDEIALNFGARCIVDASGSVTPTKIQNSPPPPNKSLALLLPTSGSTGNHKYVRLSYENVAANARSIVGYLGIIPSDRAITTMPMSYTYGLSILHTHLMAGASIVLTEEPLIGKAFWPLLRETNVSTFGGVPFIYEMLAKLRFKDMDLPSLRYLTQAGGKLSPELTRSFIATCKGKGIRFITMYGQTEATSRMAYVPWERAVEKCGSIGTAIPDGKLWLVDENGKNIDQPGVIGELYYAGPNVSLGYATCPEDLANGDESQSVLATGDLAEMDEDGFFFITGRKSRFLKLYGHRVNIDDVEQHIRAQGFDCACTGVDDKLRIFVSGDADPGTVRHLTCKFAAIHPRALDVVQIAAIPRNDAGKVLYGTLGSEQASSHV